MVRWAFDIRISNIHLGGRQMDVQYSNMEYPSGRSSDGRLIFENRISIWQLVRWTFDIRMSNIHLGGCQMDI